MHVLPAEFFIFLNFVLKIQIQYFLESECITNRQVRKIQRKGSIRSSGRRLARAFCIFKPFTRNQNKSTLLFFIRPLIFALNLNHSNQICEKQLTGRCNFWHTHDICTLKTYTHPTHTDGGPRRPNCRAHFFGLTSTAAISLIFTPFTNYGD